ncbi:MAG: hypothetical protein H0U57_09030 [Tatlockia sp.]|nr:hypothetical protein [Tatlockia sp.]
MIKNITLILLITILSNLSFAFAITIDKFSRLINYPGKVEVPCPKQNPETAVILVIGQSNAANHAAKKFVTRHPTQVFSYFNGKCFIASSPLLGASGTEGEFITPLADQLIDNGDYETVVIISSAIGGTPIKLWQQGGELNAMLQGVLAEAKSKYKITEVIWHQGETDLGLKTGTANYIESFNSLVNSLGSMAEDRPPLFYAIATKCGKTAAWSANNSVANAQRSLANPANHIFLGVDTDRLLLEEDRNSDQCHFSEKGELKTAAAFAKAIHEQKAK